MIYERRHTRKISELGGIASSMPLYTVLFIIVTMSSIGLPLTNGFAGEFMILSGSFLDALPVSPTLTFDWALLMTIMAIVATTGVVLGAIYMLSMARRVFYGEITHDENRNLKRMTLREKLVMAPLIILIFAIGLWPRALTGPMERSVASLVQTHRDTIREVRESC